jgi:hypothetical protein
MSFSKEYEELQFEWSLNRLTPEEYQRKYHALLDKHDTYSDEEE